MIPAPGRVLLRPIETESSIGRIQLLDRTRENWTPNQYEVVAVGGEVHCDDDDCDRPHLCLSDFGQPFGPNKRPPAVSFRAHRFDTKPHDWVLVRHRSVVPTDDSNLFIAWQDDILAILSLPADRPPVPR